MLTENPHNPPEREESVEDKLKFLDMAMSLEIQRYKTQRLAFWTSTIFGITAGVWLSSAIISLVEFVGRIYAQTN